MCPPTQDGTEVTYYAMLFKGLPHHLTLMKNNISLGQEEVAFRADSTTAEQSYKVNMAYTVCRGDTFHFEGWNVIEGSTNIVGYEDGHVYQNNDTITITGDVKFGVNAPEGHWFIFNENGKGATYNAPQFIQSNDKPTRPNDANMIRNGHTFGGWYADKAVADQDVRVARSTTSTRRFQTRPRLRTLDPQDHGWVYHHHLEAESSREWLRLR